MWGFECHLTECTHENAFEWSVPLVTMQSGVAFFCPRVAINPRQRPESGCWSKIDYQSLYVKCQENLPSALLSTLCKPSPSDLCTTIRDHHSQHAIRSLFSIDSPLQMRWQKNLNGFLHFFQAWKYRGKFICSIDFN